MQSKYGYISVRLGRKRHKEKYLSIDFDKNRLIKFKSNHFKNGNKAYCYICECELAQKIATVDHLVPLASGGSDRNTNMLICCNLCNQQRNKDYKITHRLSYKNYLKNIIKILENKKSISELTLLALEKYVKQLCENKDIIFDQDIIKNDLLNLINRFRIKKYLEDYKYFLSF